MVNPTNQNKISKVKQEFMKIFGSDGAKIRFFSAPGRVNLIGEHTDYNGGFVLPMAIDRSIMLAAQIRNDSILNFASLNFELKTTCSLDNIVYQQEDGWTNYPKGVAKMLKNEGHKLKGVNLLYYGNIPVASGLSSSAAIELVSALCFCKLSEINIDRKDMALLCQKAENEFTGMKCGIMDQFVISLSKKNHALFLDCRNLEYEFIPLELKDTVTIVVNTKVKRVLVDSKYNQRRGECEQAVKIIAEHEPKVKQLRDVNPDMLTKYKLPETVKKRCEHIVYENERVKKAVDNLKNSQLEEFGKLMTESHYSLRDLYEVSCTELDTMVESALKIKGTMGSRMTGAGFGGCTVSLVNKDTVNEFMEKVGVEYKNKTGIQAEFYVCTPANGVEEIHA